jgi:hypothetical protein
MGKYPKFFDLRRGVAPIRKIYLSFVSGLQNDRVIG